MHDHGADAGEREQHFRRDHALYGAADAEPKTGHDRRQGRGEYDLEKDFSFSSAEGARHLDENGVDLFNAGHGVDDDDEHREEKNHGDARFDAETEPQDEHRHEGGARRRHQRVDIKIQKMFDGAKTSHEEPEDDADQHGKTKADRQAW